MANRRDALGKGLGALIPGVDSLGSAASEPVYQAQTTHNPASICEIPVEKISANPFQPRSNFDEDALSELTESIRQLGIIQPITVRKIGLRYQIISGERRFKAARAAGLTTIPAYIKETDDQGMLEMAIVENIQREDLDAIEVALSFQRLMDECSLTQESMADKVGKKRATVANYLRLLKLPAEIQACIRDKKISMGHAKAILSLTDPASQTSLCEEIVRKSLSVRQAEAKAQNMLRKAAEAAEKDREESKPAPELPDSYYKVLEIVGKYFGNNISLKRSEQGKGSITIQFSSDSEVESFLKAIESIN
ncbi:MAG TPA: ParB/RepB/Spo0J family partition protein [Candidatus Coprenecus stercoravium]|uniref:ParB/RepB/Spo0J family partition protein n=1 Tax=Candidatus Coprenecus stercoravium TaxID=2840735 RepID=A0A9D2GQ97_9BACT|nr:ParB/RepB/Spo0J family partition protein [Candidatus Coprenecus stercoravium]